MFYSVLIIPPIAVISNSFLFNFDAELLKVMNNITQVQYSNCTVIGKVHVIIYQILTKMACCRPNIFLCPLKGAYWYFADN